MSASQTQSVQRLLNHSLLRNMLEAHAALAPHLHWAVQGPDGTTIASAGAPPVPLMPYRTYPLKAGDLPAGVLLLQGELDERALQHAEALQVSLDALLSETLARRTIAAEALERYRELSLLYRVNEALRGTLDPDAISRLLLAECARAVPFDSGMVLFQPQEPGAPWQVKAQSGTAETPDGLGPAALELLARVTGSGHADMCVDSIASAQGNAERDWQSLLCAPLQVKSRVLGAVMLARSSGKQEFSAGDEKLVAALTDHVAVTLENTLLYQSALQAQRLEHELRLAYQVQASLIPHSVPVADGWQFAAWWQPAREVSGDFYDFIPMKSALGIVVGDVTDKGMPSALFMADTRSIIRASTTAGRSPAESLSHANQLLCADSVDSMFVTLFYVRVQLHSRELTYVNAGHNPPLWYSHSQPDAVPLKRTGIMLGVDESVSFSEAHVRLDAGDLLVLYTDGLTEALNGKGERFTEARLRQVLEASRNASAMEVLSATQAAVREFAGDTPAYDDITMVVVKCG